MNGIRNPFGPAPDFGFWPFNWSINWYHPDGAWCKYLRRTLLFVNLFPTKIYENYFREETYTDQSELRIAPDLCKNISLASLFGSNGISCTISVHSEMCNTHIFFTL